MESKDQALTGTKLPRVTLLVILMALPWSMLAQEHSPARAWNEAILHAIRGDFARPTIHARNLFHTSIALYDAWAVLDPAAETYLLGKTLGDFQSDFDFAAVSNIPDRANFQREVATYAVYRLASFRFAHSPGRVRSQAYFDSLMAHYGYSTAETSIDYSDGKAASLGNYLAVEIIRYGLQDGANEQGGYANQYYQPVNPPLVVTEPGNTTIMDPDRWQPLAFDLFVDQGGNIIPGSVPAFLSPEWGNVQGFTLSPQEAKVFYRDEHKYLIYHDPGHPPYIAEPAERDDYFWGFSLVSWWSSHLDPTDGEWWDISPASIGNIQSFPANLEEYREFFAQSGGDWGQGHPVNPKTNLPYEPQLVPRGDYARVLAEFWADGPHSETPPGHWYTILNYVMDHPEFEPKFNGKTLITDPFEYEAKAYFTLGAAMHDVAIAAWAIKGWYDYIRPVSAIRCMAEVGQSSHPELPRYHEQGIPLVDGFVELVTEGGELAGPNGEHIGKIKVYSWRGPAYIQNEATDMAGVGWILAENWWPYQRPTFVTPPFAGYVSGHSTFSRAAAEVLTLLTGDPYFPGGMGEFHAPKNEFLVFEEGPSMDVTLQWATYRDASDQCSLSRIWGGIHPPLDDIPGRIIGEKIGVEAFRKAEDYFTGKVVLGAPEGAHYSVSVFPNPVRSGNSVTIRSERSLQSIELYDLQGRVVGNWVASERVFSVSTAGLDPGIYLLRIDGKRAFRLKMD